MFREFCAKSESGITLVGFSGQFSAPVFGFCLKFWGKSKVERKHCVLSNDFYELWTFTVFSFYPGNMVWMTDSWWVIGTWSKGVW